MTDNEAPTVAYRRLLQTLSSADHSDPSHPDFGEGGKTWSGFLTADHPIRHAIGKVLADRLYPGELASSDHPRYHGGLRNPPSEPF